MKFSTRLTGISLLLAALTGALSGGAWAQQSVPIAGDNDPDAARLKAAKAHTELGAAYFGNGQMAVALEELTLARALYPKYAPAYYMLGLVHMELKEDALAEENFQKAISLDPNSSEAYNNYGWFLCQRGRIDDAMKQFMTALKNPLYDTPDKAYVNAGICSRKRNDDQAALDYFQRALKSKPNQPQALYNLADLQYAKGDYFSAKSHLLQYMKTVAPTAEALWLGVRVERKVGDRAGEASYAQMLAQRYPVSRETQLLKAGRFDE
jgi:type IV pilus assembly protein PilF